MEHRKQVTNPGGVERRYMADGLEYRASDTGTPSLRGYALRFGSVYNMGWFTEEVDKRALDGADLSDVRILLNHDSNQILGRTSAGTARVGVDEKGMWYEVDLPNSPNGENVRIAVERGDITQSSWGFSLCVDGDKWEMREGVKHRTITRIEVVYDASPVTYPANPDTTVAKRSAEMARESDVDRWTLSYIVSENAYAIQESNSLLYALNRWINLDEDSNMIALSSTAEIQKIKGAAESAKKSILLLIDAFADAIKAANGNDNRSADAQRDIETQIEIALMERRFYYSNLKHA